MKLIERKFEGEGDVDEALQLVNKSSGLQRSRDLAQVRDLNSSKNDIAYYDYLCFR